MDRHEPKSATQHEDALNEAMRVLAQTVREAGESMLDLQNAVETLRLRNEPQFAREVDRVTQTCLRDAMRR